MKKNILLFVCLLICSTAIAQKKAKVAPKQLGGIKVNAYANYYAPKKPVFNVSNSSKYTMRVYRAWYGQNLTFYYEEGFELPANTASGYAVTVPSDSDHLSTNTIKLPPPFTYKGILLIEYTINGRKQYHTVKGFKIIPPEPLKKGERPRWGYPVHPERT
jgi:hypothetical protein